VRVAHLRNRSVRSCGCLRRELTRDKNSLQPFRASYNLLRTTANRRNLQVTLTFDDFLKFTRLGECHYCGVEIPRKPTSSTAYYLDRKQASEGYTSENCVVACSRCNRSKSNTFSYNEWLAIGKTIKSTRLFGASPSKDVDLYGKFTVDMWFSADDNHDPLRSLAIMTIGLGGECGEVQEKIKKFVRDGTWDRDLVVKELGDVAYYWARLCRHFGIQPSEVLQTNIDKLVSRKARGVERGSGDNR
jgi:NTP pyrophosphatase (non-canonical NTP hydrolase)/5-methylcytosine-specific restriction endonuclease McrA